MDETFDLQHEIPGVPHTAITDIVEQDAASNPEAWSSEVMPLFGQKGHVSLGPYSIGVDYDHTRQPVDEYGESYGPEDAHPEGESVYAIPSLPKAWLVNVYGSRWVLGADGATMLQTTQLERLPELHAAIVSGILVDEHSRPAKLVTNAAHERVGAYTEDDLRIWLQTIHEGFSPIMATGAMRHDGRQEYITHDYTDYHTASNLLWGREIQDRVTKASGYELQRRETGSPALGERQHNGIYIVDTITCSDRQIDLLDYAMHGPGDSPKERMLAAWNIFKGVEFFSNDSDGAYAAAKPIYDKWQDGQYLDPEVAALNIHDLGRPVSELEDFIQWYEHGGSRRATDEEKAVALKEALVGITRVAEKVLGVYDGSALEIPDAVAA